jgi:hypothetical protein
MTRFFAIAMLCILAACGSKSDLEEPPVPLGHFRLGHNVVVAPHPVQGPLSRDVAPEEWVDTMRAAISDRFGRYEGDKLYHLGISVDGYVVAQTGIPLVLAPKSVVILNVTLWDDEKGEKVNDEPERIMALESLNGKNIVGSGLTQTREEQMANLSYNAAKRIENWLKNNIEEFGLDVPPVEPYVDDREESAETTEASEPEGEDTAEIPVIEDPEIAPAEIAAE